MNLLQIMTRMAELEEENLKPRGWAQSGEVTGVDRDRDEILNEYVDVDYRAVPRTFYPVYIILIFKF